MLSIDNYYKKPYFFDMYFWGNEGHKLLHQKNNARNAIVYHKVWVFVVWNICIEILWPPLLQTTSVETNS